VCGPRVFCPSGIPSFLARCRVREHPRTRHLGPGTGTGSVGDRVGEGACRAYEASVAHGALAALTPARLACRMHATAHQEVQALPTTSPTDPVRTPLPRTFLGASRALAYTIAY